MNSVRRLTVVGVLIIGTLGLGGPTTFAANPYASYATGSSYDKETTSAPDGAGRTDYYINNNHYQVYDMGGDGLMVGTHFYRDGDFYRDDKFDHVDFLSCNTVAGGSCPGDLPKRYTGMLCMKMGVKKPDNNPDNNPKLYRYSNDYRCFYVSPRSEGSSG